MIVISGRTVTGQIDNCFLTPKWMVRVIRRTGAGRENETKARQENGMFVSYIKRTVTNNSHHILFKNIRRSLKTINKLTVTNNNNHVFFNTVNATSRQSTN